MLQSTVSVVHDDEAHSGGPVGVAVVGLGSWGPNVLRELGERADAEVRWLCDIDTGRLAKYRRRHPDARVTTRPNRLLADPRVDAVVIATPADKHYELGMAALDAGKHVFVRPSLATSAELADELAALAHERRRIVMCGHTSVYSPPVQAVKHMIEAERLGDIHYISSTRVNLGPEQRVGSVIWDLGPEAFSILLYWLSEMPTSVRALGRDTMTKGIPDVAFVTMTFASGVVATIELSWLAPSRLRRTLVAGSARTVVYEDQGPEPVRLFGCGVDHVPETWDERQPVYRGGDIVSPNIQAYEPLELLVNDFLGAIRTGALMEYQTALARSVVQIAQAADESLRMGGATISPASYEPHGQLASRRILAVV